MKGERGVVLIEVIIALAVLSAVGMSIVGFLATAQDAQARLRAREVELARAERVLIATALLTRGELEQRLGRREVGDFLVWVDRPEPSLFRVGVSPLDQPEAELLATLVYRSMLMPAARSVSNQAATDSEQPAAASRGGV